MKIALGAAASNDAARAGEKQHGEKLREVPQLPPGFQNAMGATPPGLGNDRALLSLYREQLLLQNAMLQQMQLQTVQQSMAMQSAWTAQCGAAPGMVTPWPAASAAPSVAATPPLESFRKGSSRISQKSASTESTSIGSLGSDQSSEENHTTLIVKKMPKQFTRTMLLNLLDSHGFSGQYDFVYIPIDFDKKIGTGCSFINFVSTDAAERFKSSFQGFRDWGVHCGHTKRADISWSHTCQGQQAHIDRYRDSPVMHPLVPDEYKPAIFTDGQRSEFPAPTRPLKAPSAAVVER